jgi:thymidylate kinase
MGIAYGEFVVIEGLTGSGKSTTARLLAERLGAEYLDPVDEIFAVPRRVIESDSDQLAARHALFLSAILYSSSKIRKIRNTGKSVVVDSWVHRTQATHLALGSELEVRISKDFEIENRTFFLECPDSVRMSRKEKRGQLDGFWKAACEDKSEEIVSMYRALNPSTIFIDASRSTSEIVDNILGHL